MNIIPILNTREFPLILCEIWGRAYKNFLGKEVKTFPRFIFVLKNGLVEAYRNEKIVDELNGILREKVSFDPAFFQSFYAKYLDEFDRLRLSWEKKYLTRDELIEFTDNMVHFWAAVYVSIYVPRSDLFKESDKKLMIKLRKKIDIAADKAAHIILTSLKNIYKESPEILNYVSISNLRNPKLNENKLEKMRKSTLIMVDDEMIGRMEFRKLKKTHNFKLEEIKAKKHLKEIIGNTVSPGKVRGKVKIVLKRSELADFESGQVLVSTMTVPDFMPAMKKAAAFVTDEGGITCHAAIVARELKKPCVVGTKIATEVLKDGDLVEVDAEKGVVKIIESE